MILRRLAGALKRQNWTTILIEFVLLVSGVFLGIQAANWNETRREHALEAEFIGRLQRDFRVIDARLDDNVSRWQEKGAAPIRLLANVKSFRQRGTWPRPKEAILQDLTDTMNYRIPAPRSASYIELVSAGKLGLIRDTVLRDALLTYDTQTGFTMKAYDVLVERTDPHMSTIIAHLELNPGIVDPDVIEQNARTNDIDVWTDVDLAQLAADPMLKVALNTFASSSSNQLMVAMLQQQKAGAVMALLEPDAMRTEGKRP